MGAHLWWSYRRVRGEIILLTMIVGYVCCGAAMSDSFYADANLFAPRPHR